MWRGQLPEGREVGGHGVERSDDGVGRSQRGQRQRPRQRRRKPPYSQERRRVALRLESPEHAALLLLLLCARYEFQIRMSHGAVRWLHAFVSSLICWPIGSAGVVDRFIGPLACWHVASRTSGRSGSVSPTAHPVHFTFCRFDMLCWIWS